MGTRDVVVMWRQNTRARLRLEFCLYRATTNLEVFQQLWGHEGVLCSLKEQRQLKLSNYLLKRWTDWLIHVLFYMFYSIYYCK